jgi:hypothetical protein
MTFLAKNSAVSTLLPRRLRHGTCTDTFRLMRELVSGLVTQKYQDWRVIAGVRVSWLVRTSGANIAFVGLFETGFVKMNFSWRQLVLLTLIVPTTRTVSLSWAGRSMVLFFCRQSLERWRWHHLFRLLPW